MTPKMTRDDIVRVIGPADNAVLAEIAKLEPTPTELAEAQGWIANDEAWINEGRPIPSGRVGELIDLLQPVDDEEPGSVA
jgi:hypothetical protein